MSKQISLPTEALDDFLVLLRLPSEKLRLVEAAFDSEDAVHAFGERFRSRLATSVGLSMTDATSVATVLGYALALAGQHEVPAEGVLGSLEKLVAESKLTDKDAIAAALSAQREQWLSLFTEKPRRKRGRKVLRLARGAADRFRACRTTCQLRPVFELAQDRERISGLVVSIVLEIDTVGLDGTERTRSLALDVDGLTAIEEVVRRAKTKLETIRSQYKDEILELPIGNDDD